MKKETRETLMLRRFLLALFWGIIGAAFGYYWCWEALS